MLKLPEEIKVYSFNFEGEDINILTSATNTILIDDLTKKITELSSLSKKDVIERLKDYYSEDEILKAFTFLDTYISNFEKRRAGDKKKIFQSTL